MHMPHGTLPLLADYFSVILIDILLAGDNALVIAMTVRVLSKPQRRIAITFGAAAAVLLRVIITIARSARLLSDRSSLSLLGGAFVGWDRRESSSLADASVRHRPRRLAGVVSLRSYG